MFQRNQLVKKSGKNADIPENIYDDGFLHIEYDRYYISCGGEKLKLSRVSFLILASLARNIGRYVSGEAIWEQLWGKRKPYNAKSLCVHMCRLRRQLAPFGVRIETKISAGYCLSPTGH